MVEWLELLRPEDGQAMTIGIGEIRSPGGACNVSRLVQEGNLFVFVSDMCFADAFRSKDDFSRAHGIAARLGQRLTQAECKRASVQECEAWNFASHS